MTTCIRIGFGYTGGAVFVALALTIIDPDVIVIVIIILKRRMRGGAEGLTEDTVTWQLKFVYLWRERKVREKMISFASAEIGPGMSGRRMARHGDGLK